MKEEDTINAIELLRSQHAEVDDLFEQIESSDDADEKAELFSELADKIAAHATIEEKIFYPSVMQKNTRELLIEFTEEHLSAKRILADMIDLDVDDEHFDAKLLVLKEQLQHHAHEKEEKELFPHLKKILSRDELAALGNELLAAFEALLEREPRKRVASEIQAAAPL
jgi:hypothetical protein